MDAPGKQGLSNSDRILVLSANGAEASESEFWRAAEQLGWLLLEHAATGRALREIALTHPSGVIVWVGGENSLEPCTSLIVDLRRYQPQMPVVAVAEVHNEEAERRLRTAGATAYLAGASGGDTTEAAADLIAAARAQRQTPQLVPRVYVGSRSPPAAARHGRRAPPPRIRGQP